MAKKKVEKAANHERWLLTYADMITLLMILFIVLWSMSTADAEKFKKVSASLSRAFSVDVFSGEGAGKTSQEGAAFDPRLMAYVTLKSRIGAITEASQVQDNVEVRLDREGVVITIGGNFLFESGRAELRPDASPILDTIAANLRGLPNEVRVGGHTDSVPVETPLFASNWELSSARAVEVVKFLRAAGVAPERLTAAGHGEYRPVAPNDSRANRAKNRRAELLIVFPDAPPAESPSRPTPPAPQHSPAGATIPARPTANEEPYR